MGRRFNLSARERRAKRAYSAPLFAAGVCASAACLMIFSQRKELLSEADFIEEVSTRRLSSFGPFTTACQKYSTDGAHTLLYNIENAGAGYAIAMLFATLYVFAGLGMICDEFFVPALEELSDVLKLSPDVAGATFLAAGSSAPELFTSVADTFATTGANGGEGFGMGTIVGSAMFNILVIVALSAAVVPGAVKVDPRPILRDCSFYATSIIMLMVFMNDGKVKLWESAIMVGTYILYIMFMMFNQRIFDLCPGMADHGSKDKKVEGGSPAKDVEGGAPADETTDAEKEPAGGGGDDDDDEGGDPTKYWDRFEWDGEASMFDKVYWIITLPMLIVFQLTVPDCSKNACKKAYVVTFILSILWIGFLCLLMVMTAAHIGCVFSIDPEIMGICVLAIGTSVPDAMGSVIVARKGEADMAIANAIGSNVFDILLGLGVPWLAKGISVNDSVGVNNCGIFLPVAILGSTLIAFFSVLFLNRWNFDSRAGVIFLIMYLFYYVYSILTGVGVIPEYACTA